MIVSENAISDPIYFKNLKYGQKTCFRKGRKFASWRQPRALSSTLNLGEGGACLQVFAVGAQDSTVAHLQTTGRLPPSTEDDFLDACFVVTFASMHVLFRGRRFKSNKQAWLAVRPDFLLVRSMRTHTLT